MTMPSWCVVALTLALLGCAPARSEMVACPNGDCAGAEAAAQAEKEQAEVADEKPPTSLIARAAFELQCDGEKLQLTKLAGDSVSWGARGCGRRAVYMRVCSKNMLECSWVIESQMREGQVGAAAPAPQ